MCWYGPEFHPGLPRRLVPAFCNAPEPYNVSHTHLERGWPEMRYAVGVQYTLDYQALKEIKYQIKNVNRLHTEMKTLWVCWVKSDSIKISFTL